MTFEPNPIVQNNFFMGSNLTQSFIDVSEKINGHLSKENAALRDQLAGKVGAAPTQCITIHNYIIGAEPCKPLMDNLGNMAKALIEKV